MKWYKFDIDDLSENEYNKWFSLMDNDKQKRVNKYRFEDDKKRTVAGEMLARKIISEHCDIEAENIVFYKNECGKPYVKDLKLEFNISHSGKLVVCAADTSPVGIDIEIVRKIDLRTVKKILTESELNYVFGHQPLVEDFSVSASPEALKRFFEIWTKKEAFTKQQGKSIYTHNEEFNGKFTTLSLNDKENNTYIVTIVHS